MKNLLLEFVWGVVDTDGDLVGLDHESGGYPIKVKSFYRIHPFPKEEDAIHYASLFPGYKVVALKVMVDAV